MGKVKKAALVCCSNGRDIKYRESLNRLGQTFSELGMKYVFSDHIYGDENGFSGTAEQRAESLMNFYKDLSVDDIFDISGGDLANEILPFLDYDMIKSSAKSFWGYSDLTAVINAIYAKTGKASVLYQVMNLISKDGKEQTHRFAETFLKGKDTLYEVEYSFIQGKKMEGIVAGGNIRCLLKLAGTEYWPDMNGKILLLESFSGNVARMAAYLSQLQQMGVFKQVSGILLGTFTEMEHQGYTPGMEKLILQYAGGKIPVAVTKNIGHGTDSRAIVIGKQYSF